MFEVILSDRFLDGWQSLTSDLQARAQRTIGVLQTNWVHPSLQTKKLQRARNKWECRVTDSHRIIFEQVGRELHLWDIGDHSIVDRVRSDSYPIKAPIRSGRGAPVVSSESQAFLPINYSRADEGTSHRPFAHLPASHLRILGVPVEHVEAVRNARSPEDLECLEGLRSEASNWLLELATDPEMGDVLFDPSRLLYRTTLDRLDGFCSGSIRRLMLNLSPEQRSVVELETSGPILVRGCAGSGKTTVAIYRAIRMAERGQKVLVATYSRTLSNVTRSLIEELIGPLPAELEVRSVDSWMTEFLRRRGHRIELVSPEEQNRLLAEALRACTTTIPRHAVGFNAAYLGDEIGRVIKGNGIQTEEEYFSAPRYGRKTPLRREAREAVWRCYLVYQSLLEAKARLDWQDLALYVDRELCRCPIDSPYDHVILDEAQDLTAAQLRTMRRLTRASGEDLMAAPIFMVGDSAQTLTSRGYSWKSAGLNLQRRTHSLRRNVRNTRQIALAAAALISKNQVTTSTEEYVEPDLAHRQGPKPIIIRCTRKDLENRALREKVLSLMEHQSFRLSDIAILCPTNAACWRFIDELSIANIPVVGHRQEQFDVLDESVKVLTIHAAKDLEFPVVFLTCLEEGLLPRKDEEGLDHEERKLSLERQRTLCYVAMTRAAEALFLLTSNQRPSRFLTEIVDHCWEEVFDGPRQKHRSDSQARTEAPTTR